MLFLLLLILVNPVFAETDTLPWISSEGAVKGNTIGKGDYADVSPISGAHIKANRVVKLYHWGLTELGNTDSSTNISDKSLTQFYESSRLLESVLGEQVVHVDGVINWNKGTKGLVMEQIPDNADRIDLKNPSKTAKNINARTVSELKLAIEKMQKAHIFYPDLQFAVYPDGSIKFYDTDWVMRLSDSHAKEWSMGKTPEQKMQQVESLALTLVGEWNRANTESCTGILMTVP